MSIRKIVQLSFLLIIILFLIISSIKFLILKQLIENNQTKAQITKLVSLQENMIHLLEDVENNNIQNIKKTKKQLIDYELEFIKAKDKLLNFKHSDFLDFIRKDIHEDKDIQHAIAQFFKNEQNIEIAADKIFELKIKYIDDDKIKVKKYTDIFMKQIQDILELNKQADRKVLLSIEKISKRFFENIYIIMINILVISIIIIILIAYKVNSYVGLTVDEIERKVDEDTKEIANLNKEIEETQKEVIFTIGAIGDRRSKETGNHVRRVAHYSKILALHYGLSEKEAEMLKQASPMHDIGKIAIPDAILNKPDKLTLEEKKIMQTHAQLGYEILKSSTRPLLKTADIVAYEHHEKWDGSGYPRGLKGEQIHIYGRITAVADVFDALGSDRVYKKAWDDDKIFKHFKEEKAKHFDPKLVDIFFDNIEEFLKVRKTFRDI